MAEHLVNSSLSDPKGSGKTSARMSRESVPARPYPVPISEIAIPGSSIWQAGVSLPA